MTRLAVPTDSILTTPAVQLAADIAAGKLTSVAVTTAFLDRIAAVDDQIKAFVYVGRDQALAAAQRIDDLVAKGEPLPSRLAGVPVAVKDILATADMPTTCCSKILADWQPPYDATVVRKLREAGLVILGKTAMDEFAMGSSGEWSAFGATRNPWHIDHTPGGSSSGSAAALAAFMAPLAIGSDTGGSIRQPSSFTGVVGVKPTYGGVSRYGAVAMASSLDQVGPMAHTVTDCAALHEVISGTDGFDATSLDHDWSDLYSTATAAPDLSGLRVGVVSQLSPAAGSGGVADRFGEALTALEELGAEVKDVSCPSFDHALSAYYVLMPSELSSNLARFDAMRYGLRVDDGDASAAEVMAATRAAGFGPEVKRRIVLGTYALSSGYYDAYYGTAQKVRTLVQADFAAAFDTVDVLVSPSTVSEAFPLGERLADPMEMYRDDLTTIPANLAGVPGVSVPIGVGDVGLPVGLQILAPAKEDRVLYRAAAALTNSLTSSWGGPLTHTLSDTQA